jgi:hypothetical protein
VRVGERAWQVKDLGSGNFGLARLCRVDATGELLAIKYIERGSKARAPTVSLF